jgi:hypothetical protein
MGDDKQHKGTFRSGYSNILKLGGLNPALLLLMRYHVCCKHAYFIFKLLSSLIFYDTFYHSSYLKISYILL